MLLNFLQRQVYNKRFLNMQFQDLRHSGSYQGLPVYPPPQIKLHLDPYHQQQLQAQLRRERGNMTHIDLPPRPREYPIELKEVFHQSSIAPPLGFNLNSPNKYKLKKTNNRPPTRANNKPAGTFNKNLEDQFFKNENNLLQKEQLEDFSKTTSTLFAQSPSINMEFVHERHYTPVKQEGRNRDSPGISFESNHTFSYSKESNYRTINNPFVHESRVCNQSSEVFSKDGVIFKDSNSLAEENKQQKETIDNFQSEIIRLNMELREAKSNEQMLKRELEEKDQKMSLREANKLEQKQLQWQLEQNGKLLQQIEKMQKDIKSKQQINKLLEQANRQNQQEIQNKTTEISKLQEMQQEDQKQNDLIITILHTKINQFEKEIERLRNTLKRQLSEKERVEKLVEIQARKLEDQGRSAEVDRSEINVLMMKLQTYQTKCEQQLQVSAELERNLRAEAEERQRARVVWEEKNVKLAEERSKWTERERQISAESNQILHEKAQIKEKLIQITREQTKLQEKLAAVEQEYAKRTCELQRRNGLIANQLERMQRQNQEKEGYIVSLKQHSKRKDELYIKLNAKLEEKAGELKDAEIKLDGLLKQNQQRMGELEIQEKKQQEIVLALQLKKQEVENIGRYAASVQSKLKEKDAQVSKMYQALKERQSQTQVQVQLAECLAKDKARLEEKLQQASSYQLELSLTYKELCQSIQKLEFAQMALQRQNQEICISNQQSINAISSMQQRLASQKHINQKLTAQLNSSKQNYLNLSLQLQENQQKYVALQGQFSDIELKLAQSGRTIEEMTVYQPKYASSVAQISEMKKQWEDLNQMNGQLNETIRCREESISHINSLLAQQRQQQRQMGARLKEETDAQRTQIHSLLQQMGVLQAQHEIEMASLQSQAKAQSTSEILKIRQKYIEQEQDSFSQISKLKQAAQETLDQHRQEIDTLMCMIDASEERHKHQVLSLEEKLNELATKLQTAQRCGKEPNSIPADETREESQRNSGLKERERRKISSWSFIESPSKFKFKSMEPSEIQEQTGDYIEVDREGLNYMCRLLSVQPEEGNLLNSLVMGLEKFTEMANVSGKLAQNYRQLLQVFGIEEGECSQVAILGEINGFRDNIQFLLERSRQQEEKAERLAAHAQLLQPQLIAHSIRSAKMAEDLHSLNLLNDELNSTIIQLRLRLTNGRIQLRQAMHLASQAAHHNGVPVLSRAQSEEFVTVRSFGRLEGGAGEEGLRG